MSKSHSVLRPSSAMLRHGSNRIAVRLTQRHGKHTRDSILVEKISYYIHVGPIAQLVRAVDSSKNGALLNESRELNGMNSGKPKVVAT